MFLFRVIENRNNVEGGPVTASKQAKQAGLKSLAQVSELTGQHRNKLREWSVERPRLFRIILKGCVSYLENSGE